MPFPDPLDGALRAVADEPRLTSALRRADELTVVAARSWHPGRDARRLAEVVRDADDVSALAALHAIGTIADPVADRVLLDQVRSGIQPFAGHAAWVMGARRSSPQAIAALAALHDAGGFPAMLAERTLVEWSPIRRPAVEVADLTGRRSGRDGGRPGIVVVQPFLHARIDRAGSALGAGDAGGIASLLRTLGTALADEPGIAEVVTVTRRQGSETRRESLAPHHRVERLDIGPAGPLPWRDAWVHRLEIERALTALGRSFGDRQVVWHLRMADIGTLAASAAARRLGQAMVFTAAPDPHIVIDALQDAGRLDRSTFAIEDAAMQYWFRARMVERLTAQADRLSLLPRPTIETELIDLLGVEPADLARRSVVVPEGIDVAAIDGAAARRTTGRTAPVVAELLGRLPAARRHLPWLVTVGRLHPTKGAPRLVDAVVADGTLADEWNIVVVGGDLADPAPDERSTIELIRRASTGAPDGLVTLAGRRPPDDVADLLVHLAGTGGIYVCPSDKEEFGLAIVEALAAGLPVVAPHRGGPRTYVVDGDTGVLCDTSDPHALADAIHRAGRLRGRPGRADRARSMVRRDLTVDGMAARLGSLYREVAPARVAA